ncbi:MAG: di-trans,poly-cis-decaprenylcistransferase [Alphaproteobacteria bacterium GM7ARS4]|nr:di-trans,poly-cis-decaprenylcistransferase [Alphaproteobacteria bacterium GM7ARS4]
MSATLPLYAHMPRHIAIIMDGNGRWAMRKNLPRIEGHRRGIKALQTCLKACHEHGIPYLTVFCFSEDNWNRDKREVDGLKNLLCYYLHEESIAWHDYDLRLHVIGDYERFGQDVAQLIRKQERETQQHGRLHFTLALSYSGRKDILRAVRHIIAHEHRPHLLEEKHIEKYLWTSSMPDPDLVIRTSGEKRLSNFLLWQTAYSEFYFTKTLWPDFDRREFEKALADYAVRERRYGL